MKKYEVVIETSPDQAGTYKIKIKAENKGEAEKKAEKWIKENHPHLIDMAMYTIQELNESKTMKKSELRQIIREEIRKTINEGIIMSRDKADLKQGEKRNYWAREGFDNSDLYTGEPDKRCQWCMESLHAFGGGRSKDGHVKGDGHTINLHNYEIAARPEKGYAMSRAYSDGEY